MHRRFAALAASVFLLNLNVIGADRTCGPSHDVDQAAAQEHAGHGPQHTSPPLHDPPPQCCDAVSSCNMSMAFGGEVEVAASEPDGAAVPRARIEALGSVPRAPEPPPPRG